jgi:RNA polymerase sigma-70 factor (ECF subfamily)
MMEALTPPERAVFVLHEAFDLSHAEIADVLEISEAGARQHLRRARHHLAEAPARGRSDPEGHDRYLDRFLSALEHGDLSEVQDLLADDVVAYADGGGKAHAARVPIVSRERVVKFFDALRRHYAVRVTDRVEVNGYPAALLWLGAERQVLAVEVRDGKIREVQSLRNPDKLTYLDRQVAARR